MSEYRICTLFSGSSGNCVYAESPDGAILIDAGGSGKQITKAAEMIGGNLDRVDALLLSHDHSDHSKGAGVLTRRYGMPLLMTEGTYATCRRNLGKIIRPRIFQPGSILAAGGFHIHTIPTPHDGTQPVAFVLERNGVRCGILTDLGCVFPALTELMLTLDAVILESNYDPEMLRNGPYPPNLKARILADHGHISNQDAAALLTTCTDGRLRLAMLAHLSETNNTPELAYGCAHSVLAKRIPPDSMALHVAPRYTPSPVMMIGKS